MRVWARRRSAPWRPPTPAWDRPRVVRGASADRGSLGIEEHRALALVLGASGPTQI
jgi:hypothetical protein